MSEVPLWSVEGIQKSHLRDRFDCGEPDLDEFLRKYARQNDDLNFGRTFVAVLPGDSRVLGYYTLGARSIEVETLPAEERQRLPRYPLPVIHLGRLAVDRAAQKQQLGKFLLVHALRKSWLVSREVAAYAVEAVAINERARSFYEKYGFRKLMDHPLHLYLSMKTISKLFPGPHGHA